MRRHRRRADDEVGTERIDTGLPTGRRTWRAEGAGGWRGVARRGRRRDRDRGPVMSQLGKFFSTS